MENAAVALTKCGGVNIPTIWIHQSPDYTFSEPVTGVDNYNIFTPRLCVACEANPTGANVRADHHLNSNATFDRHGVILLLFPICDGSVSEDGGEASSHCLEDFINATYVQEAIMLPSK